MGSNVYGQCGLEEGIKSAEKPHLLMKDKNIKSVCCGCYFSIILKCDEKGKTCLECFGRNDDGTLGIGSFVDQYKTFTISSIEDIESVHCGAWSTYLKTKRGEVYSCGFNDYGQLCLGDYNERSVFTKTKLTKISQISTGYQHAIFYDEKSIFVSGLGSFGQLGMLKHCVNDITELEFNEEVFLINNNILIKEKSWSTSKHSNFPRLFQKKVITFFLCLKSVSKNESNSLNLHFKVPRPLRYIIVNLTF
eukprot:TRINITY_DN5110_c0_g1_i2.p1 TRINITY_DN5110_c0_g1~~TRINITY_DN5110_c0_g1_i2.p1  ORF type:complete len:249 (+),score=31.90 TRINITY_DN5110_c0_g1_i2:545-1291(+)